MTSLNFTTPLSGFRGLCLAIIITIGTLTSSNLLAQTTYNTKIANNSEVKVLGTSNLHDWTMKVKGVTCDAQFTVKPGSSVQLLDINSLSFSMPVKNLKSDEDLMDTRAYKALKAEKYTLILFKLVSAEITPQQNNQYQIKATGNLTISGVSREVTLLANGFINADKSISVTGAKKIKMSDFNVTPPSFMLGALRTGDEVNIQFSLKFNG
jgi:polyisoprenoid-binding protein YceI